MIVFACVVPLAYVALELERAGIGVLGPASYEPLRTLIQAITVVGIVLFVIRLVWARVRAR